MGTQLPLIAVPNTGQVVIIYYPSLRPPAVNPLLSYRTVHRQGGATLRNDMDSTRLGKDQSRAETAGRTKAKGICLLIAKLISFPSSSSSSFPFRALLFYRNTTSPPAQSFGLSCSTSHPPMNVRR